MQNCSSQSFCNGGNPPLQTSNHFAKREFPLRELPMEIQILDRGRFRSSDLEVMSLTRSLYATLSSPDTSFQVLGRACQPAPQAGQLNLRVPEVRPALYLRRDSKLNCKNKDAITKNFFNVSIFAYIVQQITLYFFHFPRQRIRINIYC